MGCSRQQSSTVTLTQQSTAAPFRQSVIRPAQRGSNLFHPETLLNKWSSIIVLGGDR